MMLILLIALIILGGLLAETRQRVARLEREMEAHRWPGFGITEEEALAPTRSAARIMVRAAVAEAPSPDDIPVESEAIFDKKPEATSDATPTEEPAFVVEPVKTAWLEAEPEPEQLQIRNGGGFEDLFGRKLPIWAGGVTLLVAAVLLVKYSIDAGLLSPWVRVTLGAVFGGVLIAGAELARRMERFVQDERIAQALAGAGVGSFYAATLAANSLYHLIAPATAFVGLSAINALAMGLALRFGVPCAVLALVGGLATPALVQSGEPNIPVLSGYLAMIIGSLNVLSRRQRWFWLGVMALAGGMGWTALIIVMGALGQLSTLLVGLLVLLLGIALPMVTSEHERGVLLRAVAAVAASLQLAVLVSQGGYDALSWGLYGLLSLAFLWLTSRVPALRPMTIVPLGVSLVLAYLWPQPPAALFSLVIGGSVLVFGGSALWRLWRTGGSLLEAGQVTAVAVGCYFIAILHFERVALDPAFAALGLFFAALPALGAALGWHREERRHDARFPLLVLVSGFLVIIAGFIGFDDAEWMVPTIPAAVSAVLLLVSCLSQDRRVSHGALVYLGGALLLLLGTSAFDGELDRLVGPATITHPFEALLRWGALALVWGAFAWRYSRCMPGHAMAVVAAALGYGFAAQLIPATWLPITAAIGTAGLALITRRRLTTDLAPALLTLGGIVLLWMLLPFGDWLGRGVQSLASVPVLVTQLPVPGTVLRRLLVPALLCGLALWLVREKVDPCLRTAAMAVIAVPALAAVHCLYKLVFAIDGTASFTNLGLAERTVWELLLIGSGLALRHWTRQREAALALAGLGLAHNLGYSVLLHDPLWSLQAVGALPLANLLLPAFAIAWLAPRALYWIEPRIEQRIARGVPLWHMAVILLFAYATLRHLFCGSLFALAPVGQVESIFWSVLAVALAIAWLLWGIRASARTWRIGSLALMLAAIGKVFLIDASGHEGLLRVASFLALGFSLIGIGWLYSRYLRTDPV